MSAALGRRRQEVLDIFQASEWAAQNIRITSENWRIADHEPDSLGLVECVMAAERAYSIEIRDETFMHCKNLGELAEVVADQVENVARRRAPLARYTATLPVRQTGKQV